MRFSLEVILNDRYILDLLRNHFRSCQDIFIGKENGKFHFICF